MREKYPLVASCGLQTEPATQLGVLTGNRTSNLLLQRSEAQPTEPHWLGLYVMVFMRAFPALLSL